MQYLSEFSTAKLIVKEDMFWESARMWDAVSFKTLVIKKISMTVLNQMISKSLSRSDEEMIFKLL